MGRTGWLDRVRHRPTAADLAVSGPAAEVVAAFRADPGLTDLRPVTKAMTRDISGWILGHPAVRSAEDAWALRSALLGSPDLQALVEFRDDAQRRLLTEALAEGDAVPPLYLYARLDAIADGSMDDFLALLPAGSAMLFDVMAGTHRPELCERVIQRTRAFGIRAALTGLKADGSEDEVVRRLAPDVLMLDVNPPMDYRDRLPDVLRLRAEVGPHRAEIVMGGVSSAVDEWAGNVCGADHLTGPLYDNADLSALTSTREADPGDDKSAYEQAASWYPPASTRSRPCWAMPRRSRPWCGTAGTGPTPTWPTRRSCGCRPRPRS